MLKLKIKNMNEIKYTTDGKKVMVLGNLNNQEKIVQEIFLVNDIEIPSGENFVVKSLHDSPVVSWQKKQESDLKSRIESLKKQESSLEDDLNRKRKRVREIGDTLSTQLNWMVGFEKKFDETTFHRLQLFVEGKVKFLVGTKYDISIKSFEEFMSNEYGMKLLSLFGKDDGSMSFAVGRYSDGSGSWNDEIVIPAETYDEALVIAQEKFNDKIKENKKLHSSNVKVAEKYGFIIDEQLLKDYYEEQKEKIRIGIESDLLKIEKQKQSILDIDGILNKK